MIRVPVLLGLVSVAAAAQPPPVFQSETQMVLIDALATNKKGEFVRDLTAKDFRVWEDNKEQTIRSFSIESGSTPDQTRRLVLFLDNSSMSMTDQISARQAATHFIDANAGPNRPMAVVAFDDSFHLTQGFTENAARLKQALGAVSLSNPAPTLRNPFPGALLQTLATLARSLSALPGRKALVIFTSSGAFAGAPPDDFARLVQISNRSNVAVYPVLQARSALPDPLGAQPGFPMGRGGAMQSRIGSGQDDSLPYTLAGGTGGFVVPPSNDVLPQLQKIGTEQSQSYVLGYTPSEPSRPEACHALRVKVDVSGVTLRVRSSYCSAKPQDLLAESRVEQDLEKHAGKHAAAPGNGIAATTTIQAPFFYISPTVARVHVAMEIPTQGLRFENQKGKPHLELNVLGIAAAPDGAVAARFSDVVKIVNEDLQRDSAGAPLHYQKEFKIVPGQYILTVVFSSGGASFGQAEALLAIPARDPARLAVSALALGKQIHPAAELGLEASLIDAGTPLLAGGMQLLPAGSNIFTKSEQAYCYFEVYTSSPAESASVRLRIVDRKTGATDWDGGDAPLDPSNAKSTAPVGLNLPIAALSPGSYRLELTAFEHTAIDARDQAAQQSLEFEIK